MNAIFVLRNGHCQVKLLNTFLDLSTRNFGGSNFSSENIHQIMTSCHVLKIVIRIRNLTVKTRFVLQRRDPRVKGVKA